MITVVKVKFEDKENDKKHSLKTKAMQQFSNCVFSSKN